MAKVWPVRDRLDRSCGAVPCGVAPEEVTVPEARAEPIAPLPGAGASGPPAGLGGVRWAPPVVPAGVVGLGIVAGAWVIGVKLSGAVVVTR